MRLPLPRSDAAGLARVRDEAAACVDLFRAATEAHGSLVQAFVRGARVRALDHYPAGDIIDEANATQCFYHCHRGAAEHGHVHLYVRGRRGPAHLLALGFDARGLPVSIFAVNQWVTGGTWLDAAAAARRVARFAIDAAPPHTLAAQWLGSFVRLYAPVAAAVLARRDRRLGARTSHAPSRALRHDRGIEVVARSRIDWAGDLDRLDRACEAH